MRKFLILALLIGGLGCPQRNADINRVTGSYYDKAFFNAKWKTHALSPDEWYFRTTVTDTPTNTQAASIASGHWLHPDVVRFEITPNFLIGWRAHAAQPGTENELNPGAQKDYYRGEPVAIFRITDHFDIAREYDPVTTERSNVLAKNYDRPLKWRKYMKVDFARNLAHDVKREDLYAAEWTGSDSLVSDVTYVVGQSDPANPKRSRFETDYFEVTTRQGVKIDFLSFVGASGHAYRYDNGSPVVDIRTSFKRKAKDPDYEPLHYPDQVYLVDQNGKEMRDKKGSRTEKIWEKFGFYRNSWSGQQTYDPRRGSVESGKNYNITRFNIWKQTYRNGELIPLAEREPKPIVYYTNVEHPNSLMKASQRVASEWDRTFKEMVFYAQPGKYKTVDDVPQMWILKENSCNVANVADWLGKIEAETRELIEEQSGFTVESIRERIACTAASFTEHHNDETQAKADLERICSALEYHTRNQKEPFRYQRSGDLRYNLMNLITKQAQTPWSGLGPMFADSLTGEIVQAQANVNLWMIDRRAAWASRQIDSMNGRIDLSDILFGTDIKKEMSQKLAHLKASSLLEPSQDALKRMDRRFVDLKKGDQLLVEMAPKASQIRASVIAHNPLERRLVEHEMDAADQIDHFVLLGAMNRDEYNSVRTLNEEILNRVSPARGHDFVGQFLEKEEKLAQMIHYPIDPPEVIDTLVVDMAIRYRDLAPAERFTKIREAVYTAVMLHEIGHNMGLTHNMAGSSDALNYGPTFWEIQNYPENLKDAEPLVKKEYQATIADCKKVLTNFPVTTQECLGASELMYSSIMDYHAAWNSDLGGLGPYDKAAIKFGYAQLVETFPKEAMQIDASTQNLRKWLELNDWKKIPTQFVKGIQNIQNRTHEKFEWQGSYAKKSFPTHLVPYRFCVDSSGSMGPFCKAFDFGPDMRSQAKWNEIKYWQHYYFTHFAGERLISYDFDFQNIVSRDLEIMSDYTKTMRWYYFLRSTNPDFVGSDAEKDFLSATISGLNHFAHVLGHPGSGQYASAPAYLSDAGKQLSADDDRLAPAKLLVPWGKLDKCAQSNVAQIAQKIPVSPKPGYVLSKVKLGDGRPFYLGLTGDYEDWYIKFVGSFYAKLYAGYFLSTPTAWFPRTDALSNPSAYAINWHRLFPKEVGKLFYDMITENWSELGPVVDAKGNFSHRDLLDPVTLKAPDYKEFWTVMPGVSSFLPYRATFYSAALLSGNKTSELDPIHSMQVTLDGGIDDVQTNRMVATDEQALFKHPTTGYTYRALNVGEYPVAFDLVKRLNILKDKYVRLNKCVDDLSARENDTFCHCVKSSTEKTTGESVCAPFALSKVGEGTCSEIDLKQRRDTAREDMEQAVGFIDDMRWIYENYAKIP